MGRPLTVALAHDTEVDSSRLGKGTALRQLVKISLFMQIIPPRSRGDCTNGQAGENFHSPELTLSKLS